MNIRTLSSVTTSFQSALCSWVSWMPERLIQETHGLMACIKGRSGIHLLSYYHKHPLYKYGSLCMDTHAEKACDHWQYVNVLMINMDMVCTCLIHSMSYGFFLFFHSRILWFQPSAYIYSPISKPTPLPDLFPYSPANHTARPLSLSPTSHTARSVPKAASQTKLPDLSPPSLKTTSHTARPLFPFTRPNQPCCQTPFP